MQRTYAEERSDREVGGEASSGAWPEPWRLPPFRSSFPGFLIFPAPGAGHAANGPIRQGEPSCCG
ncbi:hypothetical protein [Cohnella hongkongensis]|uniref:Uncharacterized protein n=1 Tax=Cohnella hongkongensis TaxID=178337 RepID=A0ABV9FC55_9BACL